MGQFGQGFDKPNPEGCGSGQPSQTNLKLSRNANGRPGGAQQSIFFADAVFPSHHAGSMVDEQRYDEADEMALVVRPNVVVYGADVEDVVVKGGDSLLETEFQEDRFPSTEEVLKWVLSRIHEVSQFLGRSHGGTMFLNETWRSL
ncbi:hypothetical protein CsSME_00037692 [Camellia sinensis var. sinensis]